MFIVPLCLSLLFSTIGFASAPTAAASSSSDAPSVRAPLSWKIQDGLERTHPRYWDSWRIQKNALIKRVKEHNENPETSWHGQHVLEHASKNSDTRFMDFLFANGVKKEVTYHTAKACLLAAKKPYVAHYLLKRVGGAQVIQKEGQHLLHESIESYLHLASASALLLPPRDELTGRHALIRYYLRLGIKPSEGISQKVHSYNQSTRHDDPMKYRFDYLDDTLNRDYKDNQKWIAYKKEFRKNRKEQKRVENAQKKAQRKLAEQQQKSEEMD